MRGSRALSLPAAVVLPAAIALLPLHTACGAEGSRADPSDAFSARDSAGITIVESSGPAWPEGEGWRLSSEPALRIGSLDGRAEEQLFQVVGARRLADGGIVVANAGTHEIRWYGPDGSHLRSVGGEGEGPGEFRRIGSILPLPGDSLLVWDIGARRASTLSAAGSYGRSFRLPDLEHPRMSVLRGALADGRLLVGTVTFLGPGTRDGAQRDTLVLMLHPGARSDLDTLWSGPGTEYFVSSQGGGVSVMGLLFGRSTLTASADDRLLVGDNDEYEIRTLSPEGELERILRRTHAPRRVEPSHVEEVRAAQLADLPDESFRARFEGMYERMPVPATFPAYQSFRSDASGHVWVQRYPVPGSTPEWEVFDPEGRLLGSVAMPAGFQPFEIGGDYVLGVRRDDLEVEYAELYTIDKGD